MLGAQMWWQCVPIIFTSQNLAKLGSGPKQSKAKNFEEQGGAELCQAEVGFSSGHYMLPPF